MRTPEPIPLVDLKAQHDEISAEVLDGFARVVKQTSFVLGDDVRLFEEEYAGFLGVRHCVGVANGTDALELGLRAIGGGPADEVILPTNSFVASALAVVRAGATPVLVDCDPATHLIDLDGASDRIGPKTRALMPVHLFGQVVPLEDWDSDVPVVEDAAQAQGARRHGRSAGSFGLVAGTSFYPGKNLGAYGDAGAVLTSDDEIAQRARMLRNWGSDVKYCHPELGFNSRLDTLQAVVLRAKLKRLAGWNEARRAAVLRYDALLEGLPGVRRPVVLPGNDHVWHLYVVRVPDRDRVVATMSAAGIATGIHYPIPIHLQGAFRYLGHRAGDFPQAEKAAADILSLPIYPHITPSQQERVVDELRRALR